jgi:uncharacterized membrane protein YtjA (UPF0391 family)
MVIAADETGFFFPRIPSAVTAVTVSPGRPQPLARGFCGGVIWERSMPAGNLLYYALVALVIALVAGFLGFGGIAGTATGIAQLLFYVFIVVFLVVLIMNFIGRGRGPIA